MKTLLIQMPEEWKYQDCLRCLKGRGYMPVCGDYPCPLSNAKPAHEVIFKNATVEADKPVKLYAVEEPNGKIEM